MKLTSTLSTFLVILSFNLATTSQAENTPKPKYGPEATPLSISHEYFRTHPANHFWQFIPYYSAQRDGAACSVATVTMLVNAARAGAGLKLNADDPLITQDSLLKKIKNPAWKDWLSKGGHGVSLDEVGPIAEESLKSVGLEPARVEIVHANDFTEKTKKKLHQALIDSEKPNGPYILANFIQGTYTGDASIGHFAPIGAYDVEKKKVLVLDPDREWYEPYWISEETFLKGMATIDLTQLKHRGYIIISLPERQ
ncbi:MAG: phytochelatin synthase family protein [Bdellovibrionia bacterium]